MEKIGAKIVVIGGGTGSFMLLDALKHYCSNITALVNMADDGGSTGVLRDELGVLPPGDIRQCLVALSRSSERMRELFNFRFAKGTFAGHSFGNLFLTAVEKMTDNFADSVDLASEVLNITGQVVPITLDKVTLVMEQSDGKVTRGEFKIGHLNFGRHTRPKIRLEPKASLTPKAKEALLKADLIVIAPGNIYGSLAPALVVGGVSEAVAASNAKKVYVCNLMTQPGQTDGFKVHDFAAEIERFLGQPLDYVLYNNAKPNKALMQRYAKEGEYWVGADESKLKKAHYEAIGAHFVSGEPWRPDDAKADPIAHSRTLIRHDADKAARTLMKIYFN
ncbi:MAG: gluconeogenesis factor YvcK family protein [Candidatus Saccharimonadales bacterium]